MNVFRTFAVLIFSLFLLSCSGKDDKITQDSINGDFGSFEGLQSVQTLTATKVSLKWKVSAATNITGYNIYNATLKSAPILIKTVDANTTQTTLSGLREGFLYKFRVKAVNKTGKEDANENDVYGIPYAGIQSYQVVSATSAELFFKAVPDGEALQGNAYCQTNVDSTWRLVANVTDMSLNKVIVEDLVPNTIYTCRYNLKVDGDEDNNLERVTFTALGKADRIVFDPSYGGQQPGNAQAGSVLNPQPRVVILDENNNVVAGGPDSTALITLTISVSSPTTGLIRGTAAVNAVAGVADFSDLFMQEAGYKIITATKEDTSSISSFGTPSMTADSTQFNITAGNVSPTLSSISISPNNTVLTANGSDVYQVNFELKDEFGNAVSGIRPEFSSNIVGDYLNQPPTSSPTDQDGRTSGSITTTIADTNNPGVERILRLSSPAGLESLTVAAPFKPGPAKKLAFSVQPQNSPAGANGLNEIRVAVQDNYNNLVTTGADASASITLNITQPNPMDPASLSGTSVKAAVGGVALFDDLGVDKTGTGYKLIASSGTLDTVYSNNFNITSGIPRVIAMTGPSEVLSGACSGAITLRLEDFGGNPARAVQNTTVQLSGLSNGLFYTSGSCSGTPAGSTVTFTPGTYQRQLYLKDVKVESLNIIGTDTSGVLQPSNYNILVTPSKMNFIAQAQPPAAPGSPLNVAAGKCSTEMVIRPLADDGSAGQVFTPTTVALIGLVGSQAKIYSDATCATEVDPASVPLTIGAPPNQDTKLYISGPRGESLSVNANDPAGNITTVSLLQTINITGSNIDFTGPSTVISGNCSSAFTITLEDTQGNAVVTPDDVNLTINGLGSYPSGQFFSSPACSGTGSGTSILVPSGESSTTVYFKGIASDTLSIHLSDATGDLIDSAALSLTVTPSALRIVATTGTESDTAVCTGPFRLQTLDGNNSVAPVVGTVNVSLSGAGDAGLFYSDASCESEISSLTFNNGEQQKDFWFTGYYPETSLTLTATDQASNLTTGTRAWVVNAVLGFIGTASTQFDESGNLLPFRTGFKSVVARYDGLMGARQMTFGPDHATGTGKRYLYIADSRSHKILKYDYINNTYVGWIGTFASYHGVSSSGSTLPNPASALCVSMTGTVNTPNWCLGGRSVANWSRMTTGGLYSPFDITVDANYIYTVSYHSHMVSRYDAETGAFRGYIGRINSATGVEDADDDGNPANDLCPAAGNGARTPAWCSGGSSTNGGSNSALGFYYPRSVAHDDIYIYVGDYSSIQRFNKTTGAFEGWIGRVNGVPTGNASGNTGNCAGTASGQVTPGWCLGGSSSIAAAYNTGFVYLAQDVYVVGNDLYVLNASNGSIINRYNKTTGAFIESLPHHTRNWTGSIQMAWYPGESSFLVADNQRILKVSPSGLITSWMGKVDNNSGMSGNPGCDSLAVYENTPGWCLGGTAKGGLDEGAFRDNFAIAYDDNGHFLTVSEEVPMIKKFNAATGAYVGSMGLESISPPKWSNDASLNIESQGYGDQSAYSPLGSLVVGDNLFVVDEEASRVKKINKKTGEVLGWVGGITSVPTGGETAGCTSANAMGPSPGWCLGADIYPIWATNHPALISYLSVGIMRRPYGLASDDTWLYVTDQDWHRVHRYNVADGSYGGWLGRVSTHSPTGGTGSNCIGAANGTFTDGWCLGGNSKAGSGDGHLNRPTGITYANGNIYVVDSYNYRISSYNAATGQFNGWIGRIGAAPTSGCTPASNTVYQVSHTGWCLGGSASAGSANTDRGGGFDFNGHRGGIFSDGSFLYITNSDNARIDKFNFNGEFVGAASTLETKYSGVWESDPVAVGAIGAENCPVTNLSNSSYPISVWADSTHIYGTSVTSCLRHTGNPLVVWKMDKATGTMVGWKGAIRQGQSPTGGEPGCVGATGYTPAWCQGGRTDVGLTLGTFFGHYGRISGDDHFIYVTDRDGNRLTRLPK